ncbi:DUF2190 family protein [Cerasicoccus arenae]|nr:DUF2190 family protein [Cerasicoccus arenae]MBK1858087.1 DUF2190 family protein [Cerasicoccus arenae]
MNTLKNILLALFCARPVFANVATGVHEGGITKTLETATTTRHLIGKAGSTEAEVDLCDAADLPLGVITDEGTVGEPVNIALLGAVPSTLLMVASKPISAGSSVYTAANGKVQDQPTLAGDYYHIGYALTAAASDGERLEVCPVPPRKTKVMNTFSGTTSEDIANLGAALQAAPDKIIVLP